MKVTSVYFSPTGNTKRSTEAMALAIANDYDVFDITRYSNRSLTHEFDSDDFIIFGMPVYAGRIPTIAAPRLEGFTGKNTPCIIVATYGNRHYDDALVEMEDIVTSHGFIVKGAAAVIGRHTYGEIQMDRPNENDLAESAEFAKTVFEHLAEQEKTAVTIPGNRPYRDGIYGGSHKPLTADSCIGCGICKEGCPIRAIGEDFKVNSELCIACFRCIRNCPVGAKNMDTEAYQTFAKGFSEKLSKRRENEFFL